MAFITPVPALRLRSPLSTCTKPGTRMALQRGVAPVATGSALLTLLLTNRLLTPLSMLTAQQSRADLVGVATSAVLLLYGLTRLEITPSNEPVPLDGADVSKGFTDSETSRAIEWALSACLRGGEHVQSAALVGEHVFLKGRFREGVENVGIRDNGIVAGALEKGERAYLADLKVVAAKDVEFGYLPERTQAVLVVPIGGYALVLGANKARPLKGVDFGWIQAIANRIGTTLETSRKMVFFSVIVTDIGVVHGDLVMGALKILLLTFLMVGGE